MFETVTRTGAVFLIPHTLAVGITPQRFSGLTDNSFFGLNYGNAVGCPNKIRTDPIGSSEHGGLHTL